jgi:glycosyltransferase involved in cell wall biosynthesis
MKILITHSDPTFKARHGIDLWRIVRPFAELQKHVDWTIDHQDYLIDYKLIDEKNQVKAELLAKEVERLGQYDIVWTGYFPDATLCDVMLFVGEKFGTKFVIDVDDDFWSIPPDNPIWRAKDTERNIQETQYAIESAPYVVTSCPNLLESYTKRRTDLKTYMMPNYIGGYTHKPFDNKDKVVIAFFGSISHMRDLKVTGFTTAMRDIMKKYRNVHFGTVGIDRLKGFPKDRYTSHPGLPGQAWLDTIYPNINADIAVAPLEDTPFNRRKTNIKWQETASIPAAFVGSRVPPYFGTVEHEKTGLLVRSGAEFWYDALERLIVDKELRTTLAKNAQTEVEKNWSLVHKWDTLKTIVEDIYNHEY